MSEKNLKFIYLLFILEICATLTNCDFFMSLSGPIPIEYNEYRLTLSWDAEDSGLDELPSDINHYNVYYRDLGSNDWTLLNTTQNSANIVSISYNTLGDGDYEFAVQAVYHSGQESDIHSSSDFSAWPAGGWYLKWRI